MKFLKSGELSGPSNSTKILAPIVQAVAVLVVNLSPARTEVFVHVNLAHRHCASQFVIDIPRLRN